MVILSRTQYFVQSVTALMLSTITLPKRAKVGALRDAVELEQPP